MEIRKYKYSYQPMGYGLVKIALLAILFYQMMSVLSSSGKWVYDSIASLIFVAWFIYLMIKTGMPFLTG
ncbi:MAG: hypothetical protein ABIN13_14155, partial [Mucilaginibacter sp.]